MALPTIGVYLVAADDIHEERIMARWIVERLAREYAQRCEVYCVDVQQIENNEPKLDQHNANIVITLLWAELRLHGQANTAFFNQLLTHLEQRIKQPNPPQILLLRKMTAPLFLQHPNSSAFSNGLVAQENLEQFCHHWFENYTSPLHGHGQRFSSLAQFVSLLEQRLRTYLERQTPTDAPLQPSWTQGSPFRGLEIFDLKHKPIFFGRTHAVGEVLYNLRKQTLAQQPFILVLGASGSGKSSLVRAGVMPLLLHSQVGGDYWCYASLRPSDYSNDLLLGLTLALLSQTALPTLGEYDVQTLLKLLRLNDIDNISKFIRERSIHLLNTNASAYQRVRLLLLVDQLEELFTQDQITNSDCQAFVQLLDWLVRQDLCWVIATMRSDFYHNCADYPLLVDLIAGAGQYLLTPPSCEELGQMIRQPAQVAGLQFETSIDGDSLDTVLLNAMVDSPQGLALLEFALAALYQQRDANNTLTFAAYKAMGGIEGALSQRAESVFTQLSPAAQVAFPELMRTLVSIRKDTDMPLAGRRILYNDAKADPGIDEALQRFTEARLLINDHSEDGTRYARIAHEALLDHWPRLREWWAHDRNLLRIRVRVADAAAYWHAEGQRNDLLLPEGKALEEADELLQQWPDALLDDAKQFIEASLRAAQIRRRATIQAAQRQLRTSRRLNLTFALLTLIAILSTALAYFNAQDAYQQAQEAHNAQTVAEAAQLRAKQAQQRAENSEHLARQAQQRSETLERARSRSLFESQVTSAALLARLEDFPAARALLDASHELDANVNAHRRQARNAVLWYTNLRGATAQQVFPSAGTGLYSIALSDDGQHLLSGGENGILLLYNRAGTVLQRLNGHHDQVQSMVFYPQSLDFISAGHDRQVIFWHWSVAEQRYQIYKQWRMRYAVNAIALSPDAQLLAVGGREPEHRIELWRTDNRQLQRQLVGHWNRIAQNGLAFSPEGDLLASASYDDTAHLWDVESGKVVQIFTGHSDDVEAVVFSPDGSQLATSSSDHTLRLWHIDSARTPLVFQGHSNSVYALRFSPDGQYLLSASRDQTLRLWDTGSGTTLRIFQGHKASIQDLVLRGTQAWSASHDGTIREWQATPSAQQRMIDLPATPTAVSVFAGQQAVVGFDDSSLRGYALADGALLWEKTAAHSNKVVHVLDSGDGRTLWSAGGNTLLGWWVDKVGAHVEATFNSDQAISHFAVTSPNTTPLLAVADTEGMIQMLDGNQLALVKLATFQAHDAKIHSLAFAPDAQWLVSSGSQGKTQLWSLTNLNDPHLHYAFPRSNGSVYAVQFAPDGQTLASVGRSAFSYWYALDGTVKHHLRGHSEALYDAIFTPSGQQLLTVSKDATVRLWDLHDGKTLFSLPLPAKPNWPIPLVDFDFACNAKNLCWLAVPLTRKKLVLYQMVESEL